MPNPEFLLCDSDSLIQLFIGRQNRLLVHLVERYGVRFAILPEVETEVSFHRKFKTRFEPALVSQIVQGHITVLEELAIRQMLNRRGLPQAVVAESVQAFLSRSKRYNRHVDTGEAYSHAAGVEFGLPLMSHDWKATRTLTAAGEPVAIPVLRIWDAFCLAFDDEAVTAEDGKRGVDHLEHEREFVPGQLRGHRVDTFSQALRSFNSRLRCAPPGSTPRSPIAATEPLYLHAL